MPDIGDYVLATKYSDGDPGDHFAVGWLRGFYDWYGELRYFVVDSDGKPFRANGFRRCETITTECGAWLIQRIPEMRPMSIDDNETLVGKSVWDWLEESEAALNAQETQDG